MLSAYISESCRPSRECLHESVAAAREYWFHGHALAKLAISIGKFLAGAVLAVWTFISGARPSRATKGGRLPMPMSLTLYSTLWLDT